MSSRIPAWLLEELKAGRARQDLVRHATSTLTDSMLLAGVGQPIKTGTTDGAVRVWSKGLEERLWNLPRRTGLRGTALAESRQRFAAALAARILAVGEPVQAAHATALSRLQVVDALEGAASNLARVSETLRKRGRSPPAICKIREPSAAPHLLLQAAYHAMAADQDEHRPLPSDVQALALFGMASHALVKMRRCRLCFRWALPGHHYCGSHTLSAEGGGTPKERQARYQSGRRANPEFERLLKEVPGRFGRITSDIRALVVARLLWRASVPDEQRVVKAVSTLLATYPRTHEVLGGVQKHRPSELFERLREQLDPLEYSPGGWHTKLRAAEAWFTAVETSTPGQRGPGRKTRIRVVDAWSLVRNYAESKSSAAALLGLHPSAVSYWLRYKGDDPAVIRLVEELKASREKTLANRKHTKRMLAYFARLRREGQ